jgi:tRNA A37 threonylcarbamoyladenosine modification protein TsaB
MNFLVIDGAQDKINFFSIFNNNSYHKTIKANKNNNDKLSMELFKFFDENSIKQSELKNIIVNQGPGKFSGIRSSIAVAKALSITNKLYLYGFNSNDLKGTNYDHVINLYKKGALTKNLINPVYSS